MESLMPHPTLDEICSFMDCELNSATFKDSSLNGLQIESRVQEISRIGFAVDAGYSVAEKAVESGCQLLVVHHGLLWGQCERIVGRWARKLELFLSHGLSLYVSHLPLDGHIVHGNAAQIASLLKLSGVMSYFEYQGSHVGVKGHFAEPLTIEAVESLLSGIEGASARPVILPFGKRQIRTVGIATGSGCGEIPVAAQSAIDLFITGEPKQSAYHTAKELGISVMCIGHYASETFGVRALENVLKKRFRVETVWISEPTGI
jgi:dinuclear metal center YbgI/SA1388 family protein